MSNHKFTVSLSKLPGLGDGDLSEVNFEYFSYLLLQTPVANAGKVVQIPLNKTNTSRTQTGLYLLLVNSTDWEKKRPPDILCK